MTYGGVRKSVGPPTNGRAPNGYGVCIVLCSTSVMNVFEYIHCQINRWNNQPGSRHAILDQRFDRSENSDLSFAELHAEASQQPCSASQPLQGCRQCEPWTGAAAPIDPATAWPCDRAQVLQWVPAEYLRPVSRPGSSQIDRSAAPRPDTLLYIIVPESWL